MNWLQRLALIKTAGVSFWLDGSNKVSQPKDVNRLALDLGNFAVERIPNVFSYGPKSIAEPDGNDWDRMEGGTINWYVVDHAPLEKQQAVIQEWFREMELMGYQFNISGMDTSGMRGTPVIRIDVIENGSKDYTNIPSLDIGQSNAIGLIRALGIGNVEDLNGSMSINDFRTALSSFTEWDQQNLVVDPQQEGNMYSGGRSYEQITRYISQLQQMISFGEQNGYSKINWG